MNPLSAIYGVAVGMRNALHLSTVLCILYLPTVKNDVQPLLFGPFHTRAHVGHGFAGKRKRPRVDDRVLANFEHVQPGSTI